MESPIQFSTTNATSPGGDIYIAPAFLNFILPCIMSVLVVLTVFGNFMVLVVIMKTPKLQDIAGIYMMNLIATDFAYGVVALPLTLVSSAYGRWVLGQTLCTFKGLLTALLSSVSYGTLALMSVEKYIAILKPLRYSQIMTRKTMLVSLSGLWLYMGTLSVFPLFGWGKYEFIPATFTCATKWRHSMSYTLTFLFIALLPSMITINIAYFYILRIARQQARKVNVVGARPKDDVEREQPNTNEPADNIGQNHFPPQKKTFNKTQTKAAMTVLIVVGVFMLSWSPLAIANTWSMAADRSLPFYVELVVSWIACLNSALNPYIYALRTKSFQRGLKQILRSCSFRPCSDECGCLTRRTSTEIFDPSIVPTEQA